MSQCNVLQQSDDRKIVQESWQPRFEETRRSFPFHATSISLPNLDKMLGFQLWS